MLDGARDILKRYTEAFRAAWANRHNDAASQRARSEAAFLPAMLEIQETPPHPMARITLYLILTLFAIAVVWMLVGKIDIVAAAAGKVLPDNRIKVIQAVESGIVESIYVRDGDEVIAGDVLLALDSTATAADETSIASELDSQRLEAEVMRLLTEQQSFTHSPQLATITAIADIPHTKTALHQQTMNNLFSEQKSRVEQIRREISALEADLVIEQQGEQDTLLQQTQEQRVTEEKLRSEQYQIEKLKELLPIAKAEYESFEVLYRECVVSRVQLQQSQEKYLSLQKDLQYKENQMQEINVAGETRQMELAQRARQYDNRAQALQAKIASRKQSLTVEENRFRREMNERRATAMRQIAELEQNLIKAKQAEKYHQIIAPVDGIVQQLAIHTQGAVVQAAQALLIIVPKERVLEVEAFVENKDIGFVHVGQAVEIKVDAFPYTKYGLISGEVSHLSADAIEDEQRGLMYQAKIKLNDNALVVNGKEKPLSPGMSVLAEIKTGERRVIEFFLSPLIQHGRESLGER